jgi:von Willebrand factor type A domain
MKRTLFLALCLAIGSAPAARGQAVAKDPSPPRRPVVQLAILLDTSNSMDGLIDQAKTQLWNVVNEFILARKDGRQPSVQVALFEYGKQSLAPQECFVRLILPLTDDLDRVSEELFALKTNGGQEYCGWVIRDAVKRLEWSPSREVYKAIFIAGNEPFTQGPVDFHSSCSSAIERGILVNTIFCGRSAEGRQTGWNDGAILADGRYMSIDQNQKVVEIPTPQDAMIAQLGVQLNKTYLPYGKMGQAGQARQSAQDVNAGTASQGALVNRSVSKINAALYCNDGWDLVDAIANGKCKLEDVKSEDLPEDLRKLDQAGRKAKVDEARKEREEIQKKILKLNQEREAFLAAERKKVSSEKQQTLDQVMCKAIRDQAARCNFKFE